MKNTEQFQLAQLKRVMKEKSEEEEER